MSNIGAIMTQNVVTIRAGESLLAATRILKEKGFKHLPVLDANGALVGVVTDRDLKRASASDATTLEVHELLYLLDQVKIDQVMIRKVESVAKTDSVQAAAKRMVEKKIGCLPVLDGNTVVGIVTKDDLLRLLAGSAL